MSFEDLGLAPFLLRALSEQGYENPTPIQEQAIPLALAGRVRSAHVQTSLVKDGDHRLSRGEDIALLVATVASLMAPRP